MINVMIYNIVGSSQGRNHGLTTDWPEISYLNMNGRERLKPRYLQNDEEFLEVSVFEKSKASEYFYGEWNLDLYNLCNILYSSL